MDKNSSMAATKIMVSICQKCIERIDALEIKGNKLPEMIMHYFTGALAVAQALGERVVVEGDVRENYAEEVASDNEFLIKRLSGTIFALAYHPYPKTWMLNFIKEKTV